MPWLTRTAKMGGTIALDIETTGKDPRSCRLVLLQLKVAEHPSLLIDCRQLGKGIVPVLAPLFELATFVGHNLKFDASFLAQRGLRVKKLWDTMIAEQVIHGLGMTNAKASGIGLSLADLARRYCKATMSKEERKWFINLDQRPDEWQAPLPEAQLEYAARDLDYLFDIMDAQWRELGNRTLLPVADLEMRCLPALVQMELAGIRVDVEGWRAFIKQKTTEALDLEDKLLMLVGPTILEQRWQKYDADLAQWQEYQDAKNAHLEHLKKLYMGAGKWGDFKLKGMAEWRADHPTVSHPKEPTELVNVNSQTAMLDALRALGVPTVKTDSKILVEYEDKFPVVAALLAYRKAIKFVQSFGDSLLEKVGSDGRIHPDYQQIGAATGRMSCKDPNWQQIPSKGDGEKIRELVIAAEGYQLITADFSNIELRILAELSGDKTMLRFFREGKDLHAMTACMMFDKPEDTDIKKLKDKHAGPVPGWGYRDVGKTINFMLVYGGGPGKLSRTLGISMNAAKDLMQKYFTGYAGVKRWLDKTARQVLSEPVSKTVAGRKRYYKLPTEPTIEHGATPEQFKEYREACDAYRELQASIQRQAKNTPIQGSSADITKLAMALWYERGLDTHAARLVACVHDELVVEAREGFDTAWAETVLTECMDIAVKTYLHNVFVPPTEAAVDNHWSKD